MTWRGPWDGEWDGLWEGDDEPLAPGFIVGFAAISISATGSLADAAPVVVGGRPHRAARPYYFYTEPLADLAPLRGIARIKINASGKLSRNTADVYDLEEFRHDEAVLLFAAGWR